MWIAVSTPVALLIATVLMERFERRCTPLPAAKGDHPADARVRPAAH